MAEDQAVTGGGDHRAALQMEMVGRLDRPAFAPVFNCLPEKIDIDDGGDGNGEQDQPGEAENSRIVGNVCRIAHFNDCDHDAEQIHFNHRPLF